MATMAISQGAASVMDHWDTRTGRTCPATCAIPAAGLAWASTAALPQPSPAPSSRLARFAQSARKKAVAAQPVASATLGMENELAALSADAHAGKASPQKFAEAAAAVSKAVTIAALPLSMLDLMLTVANGLVVRQELQAKKKARTQADLLTVKAIDAELRDLKRKIKSLPRLAHDTAVTLLIWIRRTVNVAQPGNLIGGVALGATLAGLSAAVFALSAEKTRRDAQCGQAAALHLIEAIDNAPEGREAFTPAMARWLEHRLLSGEISHNVYGLLREHPGWCRAIMEQAAQNPIDPHRWQALRRATHFSWRDRLWATCRLGKRTRDGTRIGRQAMRRDVLQAFAWGRPRLDRARETAHGFRLVRGAHAPDDPRDAHLSKNLRAVLASAEFATRPPGAPPDYVTLAERFRARYAVMTPRERALVNEALHFAGKWFKGGKFWQVDERAAIVVSKAERQKIRCAIVRHIALGGEVEACAAMRRAYALRLAPPLLAAPPTPEEALTTFVAGQQGVALHRLAEERRHAQLQFIQSALLVCGTAITATVPGAGASVAAAFTSFYTIYAGLRNQIERSTAAAKRRAEKDLTNDYHAWRRTASRALQGVPVPQVAPGCAASAPCPPAVRVEDAAAVARSQSVTGAAPVDGVSASGTPLHVRALYHPPLMAHRAAESLQRWLRDRVETRDIQLLRRVGLVEQQLERLAAQSLADIQQWCMQYLFSDKVRAGFLRTPLGAATMQQTAQALHEVVHATPTPDGPLPRAAGVEDALVAHGFHLVRNNGTAGLDSLLWSIGQQLSGAAYGPNADTARRVYQARLALLALRARAGRPLAPDAINVSGADGAPVDPVLLQDVLHACAQVWPVKETLHVSVAHQDGLQLHVQTLTVANTAAPKKHWWWPIRPATPKSRALVIAHDVRTGLSCGIAAFRPYGLAVPTGIPHADARATHA